MSDIYRSLEINQSRDILTIHGADHKVLVTIGCTGEVTFGDNYAPSDAARIFWEAMAVSFPFYRLESVLSERVNAAVLAERAACAATSGGVDEDGMPVGYARWYNGYFRNQTVDTARDHNCEAAWRAALTAALQQGATP